MNTEESRIINIAYITSCREVGLDELIGREVIDPVTGNSYGYREGSLENLARRIIKGDDEFSQRANLVAVIVDDDDLQYETSWSSAELWPRKLLVPTRDHNGVIVGQRTLEDMTVRIPSQPWKNLRRNHDEGETDEEFKIRKAAAKADYEGEMIKLLTERNVDILVSDSYTTIFNGTMLGAYGGRILNIHPAITQVGHPDRLPGLTPTRDAYTKARHGWIIVDDKHRVDIPGGQHIQVEYDCKIRTAVQVPRNNVTGVTVHVVTELVDNGPVILCQSYSFNPQEMSPEAIRDYNYGIKRDLLPKAILRYISRQDVQQLIAEGRALEVRRT